MGDNLINYHQVQKGINSNRLNPIFYTSEKDIFTVTEIAIREILM